MSNSNYYAKDYTINELKEMRDSTNSRVRMKYENMSWLGAVHPSMEYEPTIQWKGRTFRGRWECNSVLHRAESGILPMTQRDMSILAKYESEGDETLSKLSDEEVLSKFEIKDKETLQRISAAAGRNVDPLAGIAQMEWNDMKLKTKCINATDNKAVLEYPKVFRITGSPDYDTDFLARLHIIRGKDEARWSHAEEFVKVLHGSVVWFMVVEGEVAKVEVPKGWQIFYHGSVEHGALLDTVAEFVTCTQIIGPAEWELEPTGRDNPLLEETKASRLEAAAAKK